jgi:shikimate dehydrogenase
MPSSALQEIIALLGCPAAGNPAQYLFERAIEAAELDWRFVTCDVAEADVAEAIAGVRVLGFRGCLLSGRLRAAAMPHVSIMSPSAAFAGGISLIERRPDGLAGHMTDGRGIVEAVRAHGDPTGKAALVVGADACGRAAALELALAGAGEIVVADPDAAAAASLVEALTAVHGTQASTIEWAGPLAVPDHVGIVVLCPLPATRLLPESLRPDLMVADATLAGQLSEGAARAAARGCCVVDGIEIHATQTAIEFHSLSGIEPDADMLREALEEFLS